MDSLIQKDNLLNDNSENYIRTLYRAELPVSCFVEVHKNKWWSISKKKSVDIFFKPCKRKYTYNWDLLFSQWNESEYKQCTVETDCCPHSMQLKDDLDNCNR